MFASLSRCPALSQAFPAGSGKGDRTTYLFTYIDAAGERPSLLNVMEDYWRLMPSYQVWRCGAVLPTAAACSHMLQTCRCRTGAGDYLAPKHPTGPACSGIQIA